MSEETLTNSENEPKKSNKVVKEAKSITLIILAVLMFRSVFFEPFKIPSGSMIPTLMIGDFILVNKFSYGFKVPFSDWFSDPVYITEKQNPKRGDVIVFKYPHDHTLNYIKRVVALPGETIEVREKMIFINGQPIVAADYDGTTIMKDMDEKFSSEHHNIRFYKTKTGEHDHIIQVNEDNYATANYYEIKVPEGHFFVMGDNRDFSADSRSWGFVSHELIKGKAIMVWFSLSFPWPWSGPDEGWTWRPYRIGTLIN